MLTQIAKRERPNKSYYYTATLVSFFVRTGSTFNVLVVGGNGANLRSGGNGGNDLIRLRATDSLREGKRGQLLSVGWVLWRAGLGKDIEE